MLLYLLVLLNVKIRYVWTNLYFEDLSYLDSNYTFLPQNTKYLVLSLGNIYSYLEWTLERKYTDNKSCIHVSNIQFFLQKSCTF